ncbi:IclR family transcriptional regulator [Spirochaetia bacterium]|nr:IclR family transcriptional regulator [Spirochaetia bacterium]
MENKNDQVSAVMRTMMILEILSKEELLGVTEIARRSKIHKSTIFRFLNTLSRLGYVYRDSATDRYGLSLKLNALVGIRSGSQDILRYASAPLEFLARETGETIHLAILEDGALVYLRKIESQRSLRVVTMVSSVGDNVPMYCTGLGKAILAWFSLGEQEKYIAHQEFTQFTEHTITNGLSLLKELAQIKEQGYAFDRQEHEEGVVCVASPVFTSGQLPIAAISIAGPSIRMRDETLLRCVELIQEASREISEKLGTMDLKNVDDYTESPRRLIEAVI